MSQRRAVGKRIRLDPDGPMADALRIILVRQGELVFSFEEAVLEGPAPGTVHDMRVAARRLRALLRIFRKAYDRRESDAQASVLTGVVRALGRVRDCDIILRNLEELRHLLRDDPHDSLEELIGRQRLLREAHAAALRMTVRRMREGGARERFVRFARRRPAACGELDGSLREVTLPTIETLLGGTLDVRREVVTHPARIEALHGMRIDARPLRYFMEAIEPAFGRRFSKCLKDYRSFLDAAGEVHDCDVMIEMLSGQIARRPDLARAVRIARLLAAQRAKRRTLFRAMRSRYADLAKGKFQKRLLRSIE